MWLHDNQPTIVEPNVADVISIHRATILPISDLMIGLYTLSTLLVLFSIMSLWRTIRQMNAAQEERMRQAMSQASVLAPILTLHHPIPVVFTGILLNGHVRLKDTLALLLMMVARGQLQWNVERRLFWKRNTVRLASHEYSHPLEHLLALELVSFGMGKPCSVSKLLHRLHSRWSPWVGMIHMAAAHEGLLSNDGQANYARLRSLSLLMFLWIVSNIVAAISIVSFVPLTDSYAITAFILGSIANALSSFLFLSLVLSIGRLPRLTQKGHNWRAYLRAYRRCLIAEALRIMQNAEINKIEEELVWRLALGAPLPREVLRNIRKLLFQVYFYLLVFI